MNLVLHWDTTYLRIHLNGKNQGAWCNSNLPNVIKTHIVDLDAPHLPLRREDQREYIKGLLLASVWVKENLTTQRKWDITW